MLHKVYVSLAILASVASLAATKGLSDERKHIVVGAIGDSLSSGFNAVSSDKPIYKPGDHWEYSWVTGSATDYDFKSHVQRLQELFPNIPKSEFTVINAATVSRESKDLVRQIDRLRSKAASAKLKYDYITIDIGGNDLCHIQDHFDQMFVDYEKNLREAILLIVHGRTADPKNNLPALEPLLKPDGKVLILEIPDAYNIWRMYYDLKSNSSPLSAKYSWARSCATKWTLGQIGSLKICKPLFGNDASEYEMPTQEQTLAEQLAQTAKRESALKRADEFRVRWQKMNDLIHVVVKEFPSDIVYHPARFPANNIKWEFTWEHVSPIDCFHPSIQGQTKISERAWDPKVFDSWKK